MNRKSQPVAVPVSDEVRSVLEKIANEREAALPENEKHRVYMSDIVREAIEQYLQGLGHDIEVKVNRGGDRTKNA